MQASLSLAPASPLPPLTTNRSLGLPWMFRPRLKCSNLPTIKANAVEPEVSPIDYSSVTSVFPAEACETLGGEACNVEMYPEVKLKPNPANEKNPRTASELVDREYYDYDGPKTVFLEEACDDLGGEFCEAEFQREYTERPYSED